ncbi:hypothetical protein QYE76_036811 [Lolium multiflorum]|uniref:DUF4283 domain-containing protein n=1 Tax=Lolium multiflorum TaxID=4521 RepID=A0AAD8R5L1_LOLMU|nr:hypothetical protein QYE76_036811 [Lolium multiflorum]
MGRALAGSSGGQEEGIDDMLSHLELNDDELDDVVVGVEAAKEFQKSARWLAIGKVQTNRSFSAEALFEKMKSIWNLARDPICREAGENLFIFQMHCLADWKKVVHQGPWTFRGWGLLVEDYDGLGDPTEVVFGGMHVWVQIHGIPELYMKQLVVDDLARRIGNVKEVQMFPKLFFEGNYVRIRVRIQITKPLPRFVSLTLPEGRRRLAVKYEKVPFSVNDKGLIGHDHEECGDGVWEDKQLQYGSWMLATRRVNQSVPNRQFGSRTMSRGGWSGRAVNNGGTARKRTSEDASLDEDGDQTKDTASSPLKPVPTDELSDTDIEDPTKGARKQLDMSGDDVDEGVEQMDLGVGEGLGTTPPPPLAYVKNKDKKQRKGNETGEQLASSAASLEEDRQA